MWFHYLFAKKVLAYSLYRLIFPKLWSYSTQNLILLLVSKICEVNMQMKLLISVLKMLYWTSFGGHFLPLQQNSCIQFEMLCTAVQYKNHTTTLPINLVALTRSIFIHIISSHLKQPMWANLHRSEEGNESPLRDNSDAWWFIHQIYLSSCCHNCIMD